MINNSPDTNLTNREEQEILNSAILDNLRCNIIPLDEESEIIDDTSMDIEHDNTHINQDIHIIEDDDILENDHGVVEREVIGDEREGLEDEILQGDEDSQFQILSQDLAAVHQAVQDEMNQIYAQELDRDISEWNNSVFGEESVAFYQNIVLGMVRKVPKRALYLKERKVQARMWPKDKVFFEEREAYVDVPCELEVDDNFPEVQSLMDDHCVMEFFQDDKVDTEYRQEVESLLEKHWYTKTREELTPLARNMVSTTVINFTEELLSMLQLLRNYRGSVVSNIAGSNRGTGNWVDVVNSLSMLELDQKFKSRVNKRLRDYFQSHKMTEEEET
eukprot:TRINITY_DN2248_c0_g1_i2.p1 TRINITY_DN2248_c0_g1~~TRINITY_DN2248_c0_g1_i2.p1  ORF type:complete len:332 (-),score=75.79 TRINITY_DN2248_c0_g1_i2:104-1099(-)